VTIHTESESIATVIGGLDGWVFGFRFLLFFEKEVDLKGRVQHFLSALRFAAYTTVFCAVLANMGIFVELNGLHELTAAERSIFLLVKGSSSFVIDWNLTDFRILLYL
jgi:hypothetical protein